MDNGKYYKNFSFSNILKNLLFILLILQFAPSVISSFKEYVETFLSSKVQIGFLSVEGEIKDSAFFVKRIEEFDKNDAIKGVIVKFDTPGGAPASSQVLFRELRQLQKKKPVVAFIENICASGGYYAAVGANKILANPSSLVGGIGAIAQLPNVKELLDKWNVKFHHVSAGKFKAAGSSVQEFTAEHQKYLQGIADDACKQFVADVAETRSLSVENYLSWADGKVFTGNQAKELHLIDEIGSLREAINIMKKLCKTTEEVRLVVIKKRASGLMRLFANEDEYGTEVKSSFSCLAGNVIDQLMLYFSQHIKACFCLMSHSAGDKVSLV